MIDVKQLINDFLESIKFENISKSYISQIKSTINIFLSSIGDAEITKKQFKNYLASEYFKGLSDSFKNYNYHCIKRFLLWYGISFEEENPKKKRFYELISEFIRENTHLSENTKISKRTVLQKFGEYIDYKIEITDQDLKDFLNSEEFNSLKDSTQNTYKVNLKDFLNWLKIPNVNHLIKLKKIRHRDLEKSDLLSKKELRIFLKRLKKPIYKALISLLYETKARKMEILQLKLSDITFYDSYAVINIRKSKSTPRSVPIVESIPYLMRYLEDHPFVELMGNNVNSENPNAWIFGHFYKGEFKHYTKNFINNFLKRFRENNKDMAKRVYPHLFRHTGLTDLAKAGINESVIRKIGGYTDDSTMIKRYVHLANEDVENAILSLHGITTLKEEEPAKTIELIHCPRCGYQNSDLDKFCSRCGSVLNLKTALDHQEIAKTLESKIEQDEISKKINELFEMKLKEFEEKFKELRI